MTSIDPSELKNLKNFFTKRAKVIKDEKRLSN